MIINGIDLSALPEDIKATNFPPTQPGRVVHIDADFLAYMVSYEKPGTIIEMTDMQHNCKVAIEKMRLMAGAQFVHLHLTPGTSTKGDRGALAIQKEYQGNRKDKPKPAKLHIMRQWMGTYFSSTLHQLCEADDGMSSMQYAALKSGSGNLSIICSKDKDLLMVPGWHMDWETGAIDQSENELGHPNEYGSIYLDTSKTSSKIKGFGQKFFWGQMLTGDTADNIQGLPAYCGSDVSAPKKIGPVLAEYKLINVNSNKDAFSAVKTMYEDYGRKVGFKHWETGEFVPWQKVFISEAQLLWMRRDTTDANDVLKWFKEINQ
jgi:hypothetical protein